jgi:hypothetical protein
MAGLSGVRLCVCHHQWHRVALDAEGIDIMGEQQQQLLVVR